MSNQNLIRCGGLAAILAGVLRACASFVPTAAPEVALELLYFLIDLFTLFGVMGLYGFQHEQAGWWGFVGFVLAIVGVGIIIGPDRAVSGVDIYAVGALIFAGGLTLLAAASWIANALPRWVPVVWILSTIVGFVGYFVPSLNLLFVMSGVLFGVGFVGAGIKVWSTTVA